MPCRSREETDRMDALVAEKIQNGMKPQTAILEAGYSQHTAYQRTEQIVARSLRNSPMISALDKVGCTTDYLAKRIKKGTKAKKTQRLVVGREVAQFTDEDWATQHRFIETAARLRGEDPSTQIDATTETFEQRVRRLRGVLMIAKEKTGNDEDKD